MSIVLRRNSWLENEDIRMTPEITSNEIDGWDSLSHINLIVAIEAEFNIEFSQKEVLAFKNIGDLMNCIRGKIAG